MMNLFKLSEQLKDLSKDQLVREMKMPSGSVPQYLILSELQRRTRMERMADGMSGPEPTTVAEDAVAAAGVPQAGLAGMARAMAPQTDMTENSGIAAMAPQMPAQRMQEGGAVGPNTATYQDWVAMSRSERERAGLPTSTIGGQLYFNRFGVGLGRNDPETGARIADVEPMVSDVDAAPSTGSSARLGTRAPAPAYTAEDLADVSTGSGSTRPGSRDEYPIYTEEDLERVSPGSGGTREDSRGPRPMRPVMRPGPIFDMEDVARQFEEEALADDRARMADIPAEEPAAPGGPGGPGDGTGSGTDLDRLYEQDRWMALARFGLGLMSSREPTLGGAIGEAGANALDYMAGARESMMDRRMQEAELDLARQRLALEAAGGDGRGIGMRDVLGTYSRLYDDARSRYQDLRMLALEYADPETGTIPEFMQNQLLQAQNEVAQYGAVFSELGLPLPGIGPNTETMLNFNVADS